MKKKVEELSRELAANLAVDTEAPSANDEQPVVIVEPSASKTDQFIGCPFPWGKEATDNEVGTPARYGTVFHVGMEAHGKSRDKKKIAAAIKKASKKFSDVDPEDVTVRVSRAVPVLNRWLAGENPWQIDFRKWSLAYEETYALNLETGEARKAQPPTVDTHEYPDRQEGEKMGTVDLRGVGIYGKPKPGYQTMRRLMKASNCALILDHKSGFDIGSPLESGQLLTLALMVCRHFGLDQAIIAYLHAPREMEPTVYADTVGKADLDAHMEALQAAHYRRLYTPHMIGPGDWCRWCRVKSICPKNQTGLVELRGKSTAIVTAEDAGKAHTRLQKARKQFAELEAIIDAEIRRWITLNGDAVNEQGRDVGFVEREYTNLSQQSIIRKLGLIKGKKEIERLRKLGVIETGTRKELRVK